jgi:FkbM family methyltransferase
MNSTKTAIKRTLRHFGYDLVRYPSRETYGEHIRELLMTLDIDLVLDVGAHHGEYASLLRELGYAGRIISFEPVAANFDVIAQHCAHDPSWRAYNLALGSEDADKSINVMSDSFLNSFLAPSEFGLQWLDRNSDGGHRCPMIVKGVDKVTVRRLDGLFDQMLNDAGAHNVFLKMDTQGWDLEVLRGADACISRIGAVQSEVPLKAIYRGMPSFIEVITECKRLGFEITGMFPVSRDTNNLAIVEFDCVMARRRPNEAGHLVGVARVTDPLD